MAVFRIEKTRDYTVMANHHLRNTKLSLKAKGLLSLMLSLPEDWDYTTKGLAKIARTVWTALLNRQSWRTRLCDIESVSETPKGSLRIFSTPF